jgi:hydrogenase-4 component B
VPHFYASGVALGALAVAAIVATLGRGVALALVYPITIAAALLGAVDLHVLLNNADLTTSLPIGLPTLGLRLRLDSLSSFFGIVVNGGLLAASRGDDGRPCVAHGLCAPRPYNSAHGRAPADVYTIDIGPSR